MNLAMFSGFLSVLAKLLGGVGVYGFVPCGVSRHPRQVGIHMALAAYNRDITRTVPSRAMHAAAIGVLVGLVSGAAFAWILSRNLSAATSVRLYGIGLQDPVSLPLMPGFLLSMAFLASYILVRQVEHVNPMLALRSE